MKELIISPPNEKQRLFFESQKRFIGYGGARGGGKSWALRTKFILLALEYSGLKLLLLRKTLPELRENHLLPMLSQLNGIARYKRDERAFIFPNGSRIRLGYCDTENDIYQYQGQEYDVIGVEECTHFTFSQIQFLTTCNRTTNKAVYGSWDITPKEGSRDFGGSGIGVTIHNDISSFVITKPLGGTVTVNAPAGSHYVDILPYITDASGNIEDGTYTLDAEDGTAPEFFRFYNHAIVQLAFDSEGKAMFKNPDGSIADDIEYIYVSVRGFGGGFGRESTRNQNETGAMVIAKGRFYPDLAADTSRIVDIRAAIASDITKDKFLKESWGKYSCATSPEVISEYNGSSSDVELLTSFVGIDEIYDSAQSYNANAINQALTLYAEVLEGVIMDIEELKAQEDT